MTSQYKVPFQRKQAVIFSPNFSLVFSHTLLIDDLLHSESLRLSLLISLSFCLPEGGLCAYLWAVTGGSGDSGG